MSPLLTAALLFVLVPMLVGVCYALYPKGGRFERVLLNVAMATSGVGALGVLLYAMGAEF